MRPLSWVRCDRCLKRRLTVVNRTWPRCCGAVMSQLYLTSNGYALALTPKEHTDARVVAAKPA